MDKLRFGTAGIPITTPDRNISNGIRYLKQLGLDGMEIEFVRKVNISEDKTAEIKKLAQKNDIKFTCHGQYYINLNSEDRKIIEASKIRIFNAARIAHLCGAASVTFHAAYHMKSDPEKTYQMVKQGIREVQSHLEQEGIDIMIRPETTGKLSQWGNLKEILRLSQELENVMPCIDFSHLHARSMAKDTDTEKVNSYEGFCKVLKEVEKSLGNEGLNNMHIHISGIEYGEKGERWHLELNHSDFRWKELLKALKDFNCKGIIIAESPNIEKDSLMMKKFYQKI